MMGIIERAYQLAPECKSLEEVRAKLKRERHESVDAHFASAVLKRELRKLLRE